MKTSMSPGTPEVTPSKKKMKQARLPFKVISETSPKPGVPPTRKRKLSTPDSESATKIGKITKENGISDDPVIIIDDDSKDGNNVEKGEKIPNPYVKLVDTAWKKKLQKSKKKKGTKKNPRDEAKVVKSEEANIDEKAIALEKKDSDCEMMEVDEPGNEQKIETNGVKSVRDTTSKIVAESTTSEKVNEDNIAVLEESNHSEITKSVDNDSDGVKEDKNDVIHADRDPTEISDSQSDIAEDVINTTVNKNSPKVSPESLDIEEKNPSAPEVPTCVTPKRSSTRNKSKQEENNNSKGSASSSKLNESVTSIPSTPKQSRNSSVTKLDESQSESTPSNLTPKQMQKKLESAKKRDEREKERQDREKKKQQEKEERAKQRLEKDEQRKREREEKEEAKRKEKEEKEEQRKKEKEEKEKLKELEKKQKEEKEDQKRKEKEEKEEQRRKEKEARDEEKRKKQEALELEKQEQELKKKKTAEAFVSFFVPKQKLEKDQPIVGSVSNNMLSKFALKSDMRLAPTTRNRLTEEREQELVRLIKEQSVKEDGLYLKRLKNGESKPMSCGKTWPACDNDDVILIEDELPPIDGVGEILSCEQAVREKLRPKLLSFHENRRPPYWGTWRKKSKFVNPRRPFGQDEKQLDYEVDSDDDWEEEQEGESIDGSAAGSDDEQGPDEYEVDNEVFVPHGYLSDEEATMDEDDMLSLSPETQKERLKYLEDEFESEMKKPTEKLKPRLYGLLWENSEGGKPEKCVDAMWNYFGKLAMIMNDPTPLLQPLPEKEEPEKKKPKKKKVTTDGEQSSPKSEKKKKAKPQEKEKPDENKKVQEIKKNQPGINMFLTKIKTT